MSTSLVNKYNIVGPRYTSYPTVPYWDDSTFSTQKWKASLRCSLKESNAKEGISIYIHLPFCESLCTFCGCNKRITKQHAVELSYIKAVIKEWYLYLELFDEKPLLKELHLGGGTPTFFSPENLKYLISEILNTSQLALGYEFSFEGHPNNTTREHLQALYDVGFRRVSFGVQDYNETVQKAIHRIQPYKNVKKATEIAREIGYTSVGHDIIFGLPFQTLAHVKETILKTKALLPDRLAFYSYAHVPWIKGNGQRGFQDKDLPSASLKRAQYEMGKQLLAEVGYEEIGMDHFALKTDVLYQSMESGKLHRNFMGYTASKTQTMIGLGVSSISDAWYGFAQNIKDIKSYYEILKTNNLPVFRGHILNAEDLIIRQHILNLMCRFKTSWSKNSLYFKQLPDALIQLKEMERDGLIAIHANSVIVTAKGKPFVRNVCMAFDVFLKRKQPNAQLFSMTV
ncbi:oxygen-independent coproporphyrinogen III oxidase [Hyunsoonleella pacifica]|uniref:Coproporphyrinogen-III oxidase n=1 Tax=Hyunsoonleella pacifica TaxID=1080224 RepID=A0A4Q9FMB7_9FLAO|nr:oxygen-independent coproporphyrinogen III oxidase [Hyunsoonleella pacifica]TBN15468.1 oxygen-independent coproporphyrinogen III oxidase [Hyunsoonleella pacifica]GGD24347.1 coproporphyrinogen-III oxidase [Hyunsoonleella pacifica]